MMQPWFSQAKFGIFLHWGIYSVKGIPESWCFYRDEVSHEDYMSNLAGFTASKYDPEAWAAKFKQWGARYAVLTTRHHDGVSLWDTQANDLSVVKKTPAKRDLIKPYCEAMRQAGLKVGLYYSHLDWTHPDYASVRPHDRDLGDPSKLNRYSYPLGDESPATWARFFKYHRAQLKELCQNYGKIDLLWFDGDPERDEEQWKMKDLRRDLLAMQPEVILNARMLGQGDYDTPEQLLPFKAPKGPWEFCVTLNGSWGYQAQDHDHKSVRMLLRYFGEVVGLGGNMLLGIGPYEDGTFQPEQVKRLDEMGKWIHKHAEAVYDTTSGLPPGGLFYGSSTLSLDRGTLYLYVYDRPYENVLLKGVKNKIKSVSVVGDGRQVKCQAIGGFQEVPPVQWITVPEDCLDPYVTVLKVELDSPLDLYLGDIKGQDLYKEETK